MSETQIAARFAEIDVQQITRNLASTALTFQSFSDHGEDVAIGSIRSVPALLKQAQETILALEARLRQSETKLEEAQSIFQECERLEEALIIRVNQQHLLAEADLKIANSVDYPSRLQAILDVIVPSLADWCTIDLIENNTLRRVAAAHVDPGKEDLLYQLQLTQLADLNVADNPQFEALQSGQSLLLTGIPFSLIEKNGIEPEQLGLYRQLNPRSSLVVPLIAHNRMLGICTWVCSGSERQFGPSDLGLAEDIVRRAALALDNALLYAEAQKHNTELEYRVEERTHQLKTVINELKNQITERQTANNQIRVLNMELEQRIAERTSQLEVINHDLQKRITENQQTSQMLHHLLRRTDELYRISQTIGVMRTPGEVLSVLLTSSYLKDVSRASIAILDPSWLKDGPPPQKCFILAEWNRGRSQPRFLDHYFTLEEYGLVLPVPFGKPVVIQDIQSAPDLPETVRRRFAGLKTRSLFILPLIAGGEWYGLLSLHFKAIRTTAVDDLLHVRGLVDEAAIVIKNMRLLETESQARREAERANDLKLKFLGMISHELRTPLTSIKGFATTLLAEDVKWSPEKQRDFLETINRESDKLHDLIEQLLDLSRIEAGTLRISPGKVSLKSIIDSALAQLQALTIEHKLVLDLPLELPLILGDEQRVAQVLTNLVSNAAKYSPSGTQIIISGHRSAGMVQIDVIDSGQGIPPPDRDRVFEAFRQLDNGIGHRTNGAGLGLAICKGLVEAQNGKIWIQDRSGPGTIISFILPIGNDKKR
jgi:signal transduction histidine kinase/chaperonin cofactor prefoldin